MDYLKGIDISNQNGALSWDLLDWSKKPEQQKEENNIFDDEENNIVGEQFLLTSRWQALAETGVEFVMLRVGKCYDNNPTREDGEVELDDEFINNVRAIYKYNQSTAGKRYPLKVGTYIFSYIEEPRNAAKAAENLLELLINHDIRFATHLHYPIAFDIEDSDEVKYSQMPSQTNTEIVDSFLSVIKNSSYAPMVYTSISSMNSQISTGILYMKQLKDYFIWTASYKEWDDPREEGGENSYGNFDEVDDLDRYENESFYTPEEGEAAKTVNIWQFTRYGNMVKILGLPEDPYITKSAFRANYGYEKYVDLNVCYDWNFNDNPPVGGQKSRVPYIDTVRNSDLYITGQGVPSAEIKVIWPRGSQSITTVDSDGLWIVGPKERLDQGAAIHATQTEPGLAESEYTIIYVVRAG